MAAEETAVLHALESRPLLLSCLELVARPIFEWKRPGSARQLFRHRCTVQARRPSRQVSWCSVHARWPSRRFVVRQDAPGNSAGSKTRWRDIRYEHMRRLAAADRPTQRKRAKKVVTQREGKREKGENLTARDRYNDRPKSRKTGQIDTEKWTRGAERQAKEEEASRERETRDGAIERDSLRVKTQRRYRDS